MKPFSTPSHSINLAELQRWVRWAITDPRGVHDALNSVEPTLEMRFVPLSPFQHLRRYTPPQPSALGLIEGSEALSREDRLAVYAEGYFTRIVESLSQDFKRVYSILGEDHFFQLITDYLKDYPSRTENLAEVGYRLHEFLARHVASQAYPFLPDVAKFEWLMIESFHAINVPPVSAEFLQSVDAEEWPFAQLSFDPSLRLFHSSWKMSGASHEEPVEEAEFIRIAREDGFPTAKLIEKDEFLALQRLISGEYLGIVSDSFDIQRWFGDWLASGLIVEVKIQGDLNVETN